MRALFSGTIGTLGMRIANPARDEQIDGVRIDGVPLGARPAELRKPGSAFYATSFLEARCAAAMLVDLGLSAAVTDVVRGDSPDIEVRLRDAGSLYIEHAMVMDEAATRLLLAIDDANILAYEAALQDEQLRSVFAGGVLTIRLKDLHDIEQLFRVDALANEIVSVSRATTGPIALRHLDADHFPILYSLGAAMLYRPCSSQTARPIQLPVFHGRKRVLEPALRDMLRKKANKADRYPT